MTPGLDRVGQQYQQCGGDEPPEDGRLCEEPVGISRGRGGGVRGGDGRALSQPRREACNGKRREGARQCGESVSHACGNCTPHRQLAPRHLVHPRRQEQRGGSEATELETAENPGTRLVQTEPVDERSQKQRQRVLARVRHAEPSHHGQQESQGFPRMRPSRLRIGSVD